MLFSGSLFHDEEAYENPSVFNPDRFIKREFGTREEAKDEDKIRRNTYAFGLGRVRFLSETNVRNC